MHMDHLEEVDKSSATEGLLSFVTDWRLVIICYGSTLHHSDMQVSLYFTSYVRQNFKIVWGSKGYISYASLIFTIMQLFSEFCNN